MAGATRVAVPLAVPESGTGDGFTLDERALAKAITPRAPDDHRQFAADPTGMVLSRDELEAIARIAIDNDLLVISDEAYEHLVFGGAKHVPIAAPPGMFERSVTIGSGGKSFSFTGWKVGGRAVRRT